MRDLSFPNGHNNIKPHNWVPWDRISKVFGFSMLEECNIAEVDEHIEFQQKFGVGI